MNQTVKLTADPRSITWSHPAVVLATGLWAGRSPIAPGTIGALWGLPLSVAISLLPAPWQQWCSIAVLSAVSVPICTAAVRRFGGVKDPGAIVLDEIASIPMVFLLVPAEVVRRPLILVIGFALHRLFDITKPPPARQLEHLPEGLGIMADDWAAATYACLALHLLHWIHALDWAWG